MNRNLFVGFALAKLRLFRPQSQKVAIESLSFNMLFRPQRPKVANLAK